MNPELFITQLFGNGLGFIVKLFFLILVAMHLLFALLLIRQTKLMLRVVEAQISPVIYLVATVHAIYSFFVLIWAALFL